MKIKLDAFWHEFREHLPFAIFASFLAFVLIGLGDLMGFHIGRGVFEEMHFVHVFFSAAATAAVYGHYKKSFVKGVLIGIFGAILFGSLSDVLFPYFIFSLFGFPVLFHLLILEAPLFVLLASVLGASIGILFRKSQFSHSVHVFLSILASLFYLVNYVSLTNLWMWALAFVVLVLTVWLPCCLSDLAFPLIFIGKKDRCQFKGCHQHHSHFGKDLIGS